jgi:cell division transport system permease protein
MLVDRLRHLAEEILLNLRRGGWGVVASIGAITVAFLVVGIFLLVTLNLSALVSEWAEDFHVIAFLQDQITPDQLALLKKRLDGELAVREMRYVSKEEALANFRHQLRGQESLLEGLPRNPLPASFQLKIRKEYQTAEALRHLAAFLKRFEGVEDVLYGQEWIERLSTIMQVMKILAAVIGGILAIASLFIVANTIRLAVYARADEIAIMRLVGATRMYVQLPFILEGTLQGGIGAAFALGLLYGAYKATLWQLGITASSGYGPGIGQVGQFLEPRYGAAMVATGALLGAIGSLVATRRFLKA